MTPTSTDSRDAILGRIRELPPLPVVVHEMLAVMRDPDCKVDDISNVLSSDQALAGRILRLVNSSFYGMSGHVGTISQAVLILGHAALRSIATGLSVADGIGRSLPPRQRKQFWQHSLATAAGAEVLARHTNQPDPEEAFVGGLFHDIGHLILMIAMPAEHAAADVDGTLGVLEQEHRQMGLDHCRAGRHILQHWKLPNKLIECVRLHHVQDACQNGNSPLLTCVALADRLARLHCNTGESPQVTGDVVALSASLGLSPAAVVTLLPDIAARYAAAQSFLQGAGIVSPAGTVAASAPATRCVLILANDRARAEWFSRLALSYGHALLDVQAYLAGTEERQADLVIFDAQSITNEQAERLAPILQATTARILIPGGSDSGRLPAALRAVHQPLPMVFSAADLG